MDDSSPERAYGKEKGSLSSAASGRPEERPDQPIIHHTGLGALADIETEDVDFRWNYKVCSNLAALYIMWMAAAYGSTTASSSLAYISRRFPADSDQIGWVSTGHFVVATVVLVPLGELSDMIGRKFIVIFCMCCGLAGILISGTAATFGAVVGGQCVSGFALVQVYLASALTMEIVPKIARPMVAAIGGVAVGTCYIMAPIIEGVVIKKAYGGPNDGWRVGYYISAGLYAVAIATIFFFYTPAKRPNPLNATIFQRVMKVDWLGTLLMAAGLAMVLVGLSAGGITKPWDSATIISVLVIGFLCLIGLFLWNWKGTEEGIFPHCLFVHRNFGLSLVVRGVGSFAQVGCQAYLPQLVVQVFTSDGILQAVWQLPFTGGTIVGAIFAGVAMRWTKEARWIAVMSMILMALGSGLLTLIKPHINFAGWFFPTALLGFGIGIESQIMNIVAALCTPDHLIGTAIMVASLSGTFTGSVGVTIFGQIYDSQVKKVLPTRLATAVEQAGLPKQDVPALLKAFVTRDPQTIESSPGVTPQILEALENAAKYAYAFSFHYVWYSLMAFAIVTAVISFFILSTRDQLTDVVAAPVEEKHHEKRNSAQKD